MLFRSVKYSVCIAAIAASSIADAEPAKPAKRYELTPIPRIENPDCTPGFQHVTYTRRMNNSGQVVGYSQCYEPSGVPEEPMWMGTGDGYLWTPESGPRAMPGLASDAIGTFARAVNDDGVVVGWEFTDVSFRAPRWDQYGGNYVVEATPCSWFSYAIAEDINESHAVATRVDRSGTDGCRPRWVLKRPNGQEVIGSPLGQLSGMNNHEVMVGSNRFNAVKWSPAIGEVILGLNRTSNAEQAHAYNLNDRDEIGGYVRRFSNNGQCLTSSDAAIWAADGSERVLPKLEGANHAKVLGVNGSSLAVGDSNLAQTCNGFDPMYVNSRAVIWRKNKVIDLNKRLSPEDRRKIQLVSATSINEHGQIAAYGFDKNEELAACWNYSVDPVTGEVFYDTSLRCPNLHAFLLTPVE